jgi:hypothetical protein
MSVIPEYIKERIARPKPQGTCVVPESTPVISFGDASKARVATLGLNPSRREFKPTARLALCGSSPEEVLEGCIMYFRRNPYRNWFDKLSPSLNAFEASYEEASACHLDLVQWATDPTWGRIKPSSIRNRLLDQDAPFLERQLRTNKNIDLLLVNGSGAWRQLCRRLHVEKIHQFPDSLSGLAHQPTRFYSGYLFDRLKILAWSTNLQSACGVQSTLWQTILPKRLQQLHKSALPRDNPMKKPLNVSRGQSLNFAASRVPVVGVIVGSEKTQSVTASVTVETNEPIQNNAQLTIPEFPEIGGCGLAQPVRKSGRTIVVLEIGYGHVDEATIGR